MKLFMRVFLYNGLIFLVSTMVRTGGMNLWYFWEGRPLADRTLETLPAGCIPSLSGRRRRRWRWRWTTDVVVVPMG